MEEACLTIGIDSSSTSCGIAIFKDGELSKSFTKKFEGSFSILKFRQMAEYFDDLFFEYQPDIVLMEEPIAMRNGRTTMILNQIAGMIFGLASSHAKTIDMIHNKTIKKEMGFKTKEESIQMVKKLHGKRVLTDDESDAILLIDTYIKLVGAL